MRRALLLSVAAFIAIAGCGKREREAATSGEMPSTAPASSGNTLGARVGPKSDPLLAAAAPRLSEWSRRWAAVLPGFMLDSLYREASSRMPDFYPRAAGADDIERARVFGELSPDSTRIVEPDSYREKGRTWQDWGGDADSAPALLDLRTDSLYTLTVIGPSFAFEDAFWVDRQRFVIVGLGEREFDPWQGGGDLWVYDLARGTLTLYHTPSVNKDAYGRYMRLSDAAEKERVARRLL
jgi:hypothetical protein